MREFIIGTDWWTDCDDAVAMRILCRAHLAGQIRILGIGMNACMEHSVPSLDAFLTQEGVSNIPIGVDLDANDFGGNPPYQKRLAKSAKYYLRNEDAQNAVRLYRRLLANATAPVEIIEIGYLNVLSNLLSSQSDDISPLSGMELVREKVTKMWLMAGKWNVDGGIENNFARNDRSRQAAAYFCQNCPVPVTFLGFEIGHHVLTGGPVLQKDHLYYAMYDHGSADGRHSWDPMLVVMALIGDENTAGYDTVSGTATVDADTGANHFSISPLGMHKYVVKTQPDEYYVNQINNLIQ